VLSDGAAAAGDDIVQAGTGHGGAVPGDVIASFTRALPLASGTCLADAAIAEVRPSQVTPAVRYLGSTPNGTRALTGVGVGVMKSGDQTGLTYGVVSGIQATVGPYSANGVSGIYFTDAIVTTGMSQPGDSGAVVMDFQRRAVGLLFGGLQTTLPGGATVGTSWCCPIDTVLGQLQVHLP
jgi:hypothetical protein